MLAAVDESLERRVGPASVGDGPVAMLERLVGDLERVVRGLEPGCFDGPGAVRLVELFARGEHVAAAGKALMATRVAATWAYRVEGHQSAASWLARATGVTVGQAAHSLEAAARATGLPATREALVSGELSEVQAYEVTQAAAVNPAAEGSLLEAARGRTLKGLRETCARVRAASVDDDAEWDRRLHATRSVSKWVEAGGRPRLEVWFTPEAGARMFAALEAETDRQFRVARAEGRCEPRGAYMHDALVQLVEHGPSKPIDVRLSADATAIARGHVIEGERCEVAGIGPIPVSAARRMMTDATITTMFTEAGEITRATSPNRTIPASLRRWLEEAYTTCGRSGCDNTQRLIIDHVVDYAEILRSGTLPPTTKANTWRLCPWCHDLKHHHHWKIVLGPDGRLDLVPPDHPDPPYRPPP